MIFLAPLLILSDALDNTSLELLPDIAGARGCPEMFDLAKRPELSVVLANKLSNIMMQHFVSFLSGHRGSLLDAFHATLRERLVNPELLERRVHTLEVLKGDRLRVLLLQEVASWKISGKCELLYAKSIALAIELFVLEPAGGQADG